MCRWVVPFDLVLFSCCYIWMSFLMACLTRRLLKKCAENSMLSLRLLCLLILLPMDGSVKHWNAFELLMVQVHRPATCSARLQKRADLVVLSFYSFWVLRFWV